MKMIESGFELQGAAADIFSSRLDRDRCLLVQQLRWLVDDAGSDADVSGEYRATSLFTAREQSSPDKKLINPYLFGHVFSSAGPFVGQKPISESKVINQSNYC